MASYQEIEELWTADCEINPIQLGEEAAKIPKLHNRYYSLYVKELFVLRKQEAEMKTLERNLWLYYSGSITRSELLDLGWNDLDLKILKTDVAKFIDSDQKMIEMKLKYSVQDEKCSFIKSILAEVGRRSYIIRQMIDWAKFQAGA